MEQITKQTYLQHLRDKFYARAQSARKKIAEYRKNQKVAREERKEFNDFWRDFLKERGVPKAFKNINPRDNKWMNDMVVLKTFQDAVKKIDSKDRPTIVQYLNDMVTNNASSEGRGYFQQRLGYEIFRRVTGESFGSPRFSSMMTVEDVQKRNFFDFIHKGIVAYKHAPAEIREKFNKAVLPKVKKERVVAPIVSQQQR